MLIPFDLKSGQPDWGSLQETSIGEFQLQEFLGADATSAVFRAEMASKGRTSAVVKFYKVEQDSVAENQTEIWEEAKKLDHPNLIGLLGAGRVALGDHKLIYVAVEPADESLSSALAERRLEPAEATEILTSTRSGLHYLHSHGFIHSCLSPEQIFAVGDAIKLSTEGLRKPGPVQRLMASNPKYVAPESDEANTSRAADVWCLGATLLEALTRQKVTSGNWSAQAVPLELRGVVQRCLNDDPNLRSNLSQIDQEPVTPEQPAKPVALGQEPTALPHVTRLEPPKTLYPRKAERAGLPFWAYAVGSVVLIAALVWLFRPAAPTPKTGEPQKAVPAAQQRTIQPSGEPAPVPPAESSEKPSPVQRPPAGKSQVAVSTPRAGESAAGQTSDVWRVIVYTYDQESAAKERAIEINKKYPQLKAEMFSPDGKSPFLVTVGGTTMSKAQARSVRQDAVHLGMPRDSYTQNFAH
jgi:hypothetical protein